MSLRSRRANAFWVRWLALVVQLVVGLLPLQATGVLHAVADVTTLLAGEALHQGEPPCADEQRGERCPPDCSHCHCGWVLPVVPVAWPVVAPARVRTLRPVESVYDATAPPRLVVSGLERPPRGDKQA